MALRTNNALVYLANTDSGTQNAWAPGLKSGAHTLIQWNGTANITINGISSTGMAPGTMVTVNPIAASFVFFFFHQSGSASASNRLYLSSTDVGSWAFSRGSVTFVWNGTYWWQVNHQHGNGLGTTFNAAHYTASSAGTWTVETGDVSIRQSIMETIQRIQLSVVGTDVAQSGAQPTMLKISTSALTGGTYDTTGQIFPCIIVDNGTRTMGYVTTNGTSLDIKKLDDSQFATAAGTTSVYMNIMLNMG